MNCAEKLIVLKMNTQDAEEFVGTFKEAVLETMMLIFERRELDLCEDQLYGLYTLCRAAKVCTIAQLEPNQKVKALA